MNYRHAFHAGNFADVLKHAILARVLDYMKRKAQAFRVVDTHAGAGLYDLHGSEAQKTGEWREGIGRLIDAELPPRAANFLQPYLEAVRAVNEPSAFRYYPGSPLIARHMLRRDDTLIANELHAEDAARLRGELKRWPSAKVLELDAWTVLRAVLPPKERRGVVVIDPPFEARDEFSALGDGLEAALGRFASGVYLVWYPVKERALADAFVDRFLSQPTLKVLDVRLAISEPFAGLGLTECGVMLINPPYTLQDELAVVLPVVEELLAEGRGSSNRLICSRP